MALQVPSLIRRAVPASKGIIQNSVTGIGFNTVALVVDGIFGSPVSRIFSFNLPFIGPVGPIDVLNYVVHAGGLKMSKKGLVAVLAAKAAQTGAIAGFNIVNIGAGRIPATTASIGGQTGQPIGAGMPQ